MAVSARKPSLRALFRKNKLQLYENLFYMDFSPSKGPTWSDPRLNPISGFDEAKFISVYSEDYLWTRFVIWRRNRKSDYHPSLSNNFETYPVFPC
jgi:hypothetical protein